MRKGLQGKILLGSSLFRVWFKKVIPLWVMGLLQKLRKKVYTVYYQGDKVECPVCRSRFRKFAPFGNPGVKNEFCPKCSSLRRGRLIWKYLNERTELFTVEHIRLLHFAPEEGFYGIFSNMQNVEYVPCDLFPDVYGWYADGVKIRKADITDIPFEPDSFDVVLCNHVLEHIPDDRRAMSELYRVMKKGAWAILQVPIDYNREKTYEDFSITDPCGRTKAFGQHDHVRWYGRDYADRLRSVGFTVIEETYVKTLPQADVSRYGLDPSEILYFCRKE